MKGPGLKPPIIGRFRKEVIGPPDCPLMHRWTLLSGRLGKLLLHHFLPNADDRDVHDHPRPFVTIVLSGEYDDLVPCPWCQGAICVECEDVDGLIIGERMRRGMVRFRRAEHAHRTRVGPNGCWTIVIMGSLRRPWGFWREGKWWAWRDYERHFGFGMRCERDDQ